MGGMAQNSWVGAVMPIGFVVAMPLVFGIVLGLIVWAGIKEKEE
jgi:hypothetical protein